VRGRRVWIAGLALAHAVPAIVVWGALGAALGALGTSRAVKVVAVTYALVYGISETLRFPIRSPSLRWQVPSTWVRHRSSRVRVLVWGAALGPGLLTRNPYAGMWLVPLALALVGDVRTGLACGAAAGAAHGVARAFGLRSNIRSDRGRTDFALVADQLRWKLVDGLALLVAAGIIALSA
jgi:hypothetical protein